MSYITMEIWTGIWILVRFLPTALIIFAGVMIIELGIEFIQKKKIEVKILNWLCQFLWILIVVSILKITGIIGGSFGISSPLDSYISFKLFEDGFNAATILNICLFVPYGFLPVFILKYPQALVKWRYTWSSIFDWHRIFANIYWKVCTVR